MYESHFSSTFSDNIVIKYLKYPSFKFHCSLTMCYLLNGNETQ